MAQGKPGEFEVIMGQNFTEDEGRDFDVLAHMDTASPELVELPVGALRDAFHSLCDDKAIGQDPEFLGKAVSELLPRMVDDLSLCDHVRVENLVVFVREWGPMLAPEGSSVRGDFAGFLPDETYIFDTEMAPTGSCSLDGLYVILDNAVAENGRGESLELGSVQVLISDGAEKLLRVVSQE